MLHFVFLLVGMKSERGLRYSEVHVGISFSSKWATNFIFNDPVYDGEGRNPDKHSDESKGSAKKQEGEKTTTWREPC